MNMNIRCVWFLLAGTLVLATSACSRPLKNAQVTGLKSPLSTGIVGGENLSKNSNVARSVVALVSENSQGEALCTGTLLSQDVVLTAAHCVAGHPSHLAIVFSVTVNLVKSNDVRAADRFVQHPRWFQNLSDDRGDLALIHFPGGIPADYEPVELADQGFVPARGKHVLFVGYGVKDGLSRSGSGRLRETESMILAPVSRTEVLSDGEQSGVCFGDSGGPAFAREGSKLVQWGVASSVTNSACNAQAIHTLVAPYLNWIQSTIAKF